MSSLLRYAATLALASFAIAQSPLTTLYTGGNGLGGNSNVYFDLTVNAPVLVNQLDVSALGGTGASSIEFWTVPTTWVGNEGNPGAWTLLGSSASVTAVAQGSPTIAPITTPFTLSPGTFGVAIVYRGTLGPSYTNGTGTNQVYSTAEMTLTAGASGGIFTAGVNNPRVWNGSIHYTLAGPGTVATKTNYGSGCYARYASFYEQFLTTPSIDLSNTAFQLINTGTGYLALPSTSAFVPPSATVTNLGLGDDAETTITLSSAMPYPGGSTSSLNVCSNGHISTASNGAAFDYTPTPGEFLNWPNATWAVWRDFISGAAGGAVKFEEIAGIAYVTWDAVVGYSGTATGTVPSTFQLQFHVATGNVDFVFLSMDTISISGWTGGEGWIVGFSPAGASADPGSIDLTAVLPGSFTTELTDLAPLALDASARPISGTTIQLALSNVPGASVGLVVLNFSSVVPGLDLGYLGMPGCTQHIGLGGAVTLGVVIGNGSLGLGIPNDPFYHGFNVFAQGAALVSGVNPLGGISSNGVRLVYGNL